MRLKRMIQLSLAIDETYIELMSFEALCISRGDDWR